MSKPFLRVWAQFSTTIESSSTVVGPPTTYSLVVEDASKFEIDDSVTVKGTNSEARGLVYHVDYSTDTIILFSETFSTVDTPSSVEFVANFMYYGLPHLGTIRYLDWRDYNRNIKGVLIPQSNQLQVVEWSVPLFINGLITSDCDRTVNDLLTMFQVLSTKEIVVEMLDEGFIQRIFQAYITNETLGIAESSNDDFDTQLSFIGLLEVAV